MLINLCKCGKPKKMNSKQTGLLYYCGDKKCHSHYGKKRPEHSAKMKQLALAGLNSSNWKKGHKNDYVNTIEWKRKVLENKGIDHHTMSDDQLLIFFNQYKSELITTITTLFERYKDEYKLSDLLNIDKLDQYSIEQLREFSKPLNSLKTLIANKNGKGIAKKFKRIRLENFKYNIVNQEYVITRSSYEANYINFFEKNKIWWDYESLTIPTENKYTVPDFLFYFKDKKYILEVKGFLLDKDEYFNNKLKYVYKYAVENDFELLFTFKEKPTKIEELIKEKYVC
jgi:hypothetical protein